MVTAAALSISAEIAASRARLETVLARLERAEKAAKDREADAQNYGGFTPSYSYFKGRRIQFDDSYEEEDHFEHQMAQVLFSELTVNDKLGCYLHILLNRMLSIFRSIEQVD